MLFRSLVEIIWRTEPCTHLHWRSEVGHKTLLGASGVYGEESNDKREHCQGLCEPVAEK
jgi:hypothetical protein